MMDEIIYRDCGCGYRSGRDDQQMLGCPKHWHAGGMLKMVPHPESYIREQIAKEHIEKILAEIPKWQGLYENEKKITPAFLDERIAECFEIAANTLRNETYHEQLVRLGLPTSPVNETANLVRNPNV